MKNFEELRQQMVESQLISRGVKDKRVLDVMRNIPREMFISDDLKGCAYEDRPLPIGYGQTISQPYIVALMTESLELKGDEKVLEIGTGSGYQAAILSRLAKHVFTIERNASLADRAQEVLKKLKINNVHIKVGDGSLGLPQEAPFSGILVTAASFEIPSSLMAQLSEGGRLVIPVGDRLFQNLLL